MRWVRNGTRCRRISSGDLTRRHTAGGGSALKSILWPACWSEGGPSPILAIPIGSIGAGATQSVLMAARAIQQSAALSSVVPHSPRVPLLSSVTAAEVARVQPAKRVYQSIKLTEKAVGIDGAGKAA